MIWAHAKNGRIAAVFPGSEEVDVQAVGAVLGADTVAVPSGTQVGATLVDGSWVNPPPPAPPPPPPRPLPSTEFRARFTALEEAAVLTLARTDPVVQVFYSRLLDPRQINVHLDDPAVTAGLGYLTTLDDPLRTGDPRPKVLTAARIAEILA